MLRQAPHRPRCFVPNTRRPGFRTFQMINEQHQAIEKRAARQVAKVR